VHHVDVLDLVEVQCGAVFQHDASSFRVNDKDDIAIEQLLAGRRQGYNFECGRRRGWVE